MEEEMQHNDTTIYIVRHGQSEGSISDVYGTDPDLTKKGVQQAEETADLFASIHLDRVFASKLKRAQHMAAIIAARHALPVETFEDLREPDYGKLEGRNRKEVKEQYKERFQQRKALTEQERMRFKLVEDMESDEEALMRFLGAVNRLAEANPRQTLLVISHVPLMKLLLMHLGFATRKQLDGESIENGGYIKIASNGKEVSILDTKGVHAKE
jgi:broad specificity phosphatase PhoE